MKEMEKNRIVTKRYVNSVMNERKLLSQLKHPFLVNIIYAFQDKTSLYQVTDLMTGGDLRYHMSGKKKKVFTEEEAKFIICCVILGLEFMHSNGVLHRDIKPENLLMDPSGYIRITDLGISRIWTTDNSQETSGTPGYTSPEVM